MLKIKILLFFVFAFGITSIAQQKYLIYFKDKGEGILKTFDKSKIESELLSKFSQKTIERRKKVLGENIFIYEDYPIFIDYINGLKNLGVKIENELTWFNSVSAYLSNEQLEKVLKLPYIAKVEKVKTLKFKSNQSMLRKTQFSELAYFPNGLDYGLSFTQLQLSRIPEVHSKGITGENVLIGLLDTGFRWRVHEALQNSTVISERDFIFKDDNLSLIHI
ncbi:MAG: hypothetical protein N3A61_07805 [Ignavibacteria bacterium]|nr:hypothetical protein [Ignavibacteria bacterium]